MGFLFILWGGIFATCNWDNSEICIGRSLPLQLGCSNCGGSMVRLWRCRYYRCHCSGCLESQSACLSVSCLSVSWLVCMPTSELLSVGSHGSSSFCLDSHSDFLIVQGVELVKVEKFWCRAIHCAASHSSVKVTLHTLALSDVRFGPYSCIWSKPELGRLPVA